MNLICLILIMLLCTVMYIAYNEGYFKGYEKSTYEFYHSLYTTIEEMPASEFKSLLQKKLEEHKIEGMNNHDQNL